MAFKIQWLDKERKTQCPPNPDFPTGVDIDTSQGSTRACKVDLPYPAVRCGVYVVSCDQCGQIATVTTAGRADDPRSMKFPCKQKVH